jgi:hypothetical protein
MEVDGGIRKASWDVRASLLPVCSNLFKDGGNGENNGFSRKLRNGRQGWLHPAFLFFKYSNRHQDNLPAIQFYAGSKYIRIFTRGPARPH